MVHFIDFESAELIARNEAVVFAQVAGRAEDRHTLEVHVMRPSWGGLHEVERTDTGGMTDEGARDLVERIATVHGCRYATICRAEDRRPPPWTSSA